MLLTATLQWASLFLRGFIARAHNIWPKLGYKYEWANDNRNMNTTCKWSFSTFNIINIDPRYGPKKKKVTKGNLDINKNKFH